MITGQTNGACLPQVAGFGDWARPRRIRLAGLTAGLICEVLVAVPLLVRASRP
jgi:hypothetical protein